MPKDKQQITRADAGLILIALHAKKSMYEQIGLSYMSNDYQKVIDKVEAAYGLGKNTIMRDVANDIEVRA